MLLRHVVSITDRLQAARADLLAYAAGETGTLRVGVYQSVGTRVLPAIIGRFAEAWPNVEIRLTEANSDQGLYELLGPGALDLSFGVLPLQEGPFEAVELLDDPFVLVTAAGSPLAALRGQPSSQLIGEQRLIGFRSCRSTRWVEEHLAHAAPSRTSCSDPRTTARSRRWWRPDSVLRWCRSSPSTRRTLRDDHPHRPAGPSDRAHLAPRPLSVAGRARVRRARRRRVRRSPGGRSHRFG